MTISQDKARQLEERTIIFSLDVIKMTKNIATTPENKILINQIIKSSTSIGANYTEANNAASRVDFRHKIYIAKKEAAETRYWLRLLGEVNKNLNLDNLIDECTQLLLILQKIISTLKNGKR